MFFRISADEVLDLRKPLYGNGDSSDYWGVTFARHAKDDLQLTPTSGDPSLYILIPLSTLDREQEEEDAEGVMGVYVDEKFPAGNEKFQELTEATLAKLESRPRAWDNFEFFGCDFRTVEQDISEVDQREYIANIGLVPADVNLEKYRSLRAESAWATHNRQDVRCCVNRAAQVVAGEFENVREAHMMLLNSAIKKMKSTPELSLKYCKLDEAILHIRVYTDASFGTNDDMTSQLGLLVLLCDNEDKVHIMDVGSKKWKRVVR